jgi:sulfur carrier protein
MNILLNGEPQTVQDNITAAQLLESLQLTGKRLAMEVNQEIVPRSQFQEFVLKADDRVEIVHAIGGG